MYVLFCICCFHRSKWNSSATLTEVFPFFFLSCKANARVYLAKTGHCPHSSQLVNCVVLLFFVLIALFYVFFVCKCVLYCTVLLPPGVNSIKVNKYININIIATLNMQQLSIARDKRIINGTLCVSNPPAPLNVMPSNVTKTL